MRQAEQVAEPLAGASSLGRAKESGQPALAAHLQFRASP